jgi:sec-independent protein translocase protein TatA
MKPPEPRDTYHQPDQLLYEYHARPVQSRRRRNHFDLAIILILFGAKKLPELARGLGQGIKEFKKATQNASEGLREAMAESLSTAPRRLALPTTASVDPECIVPKTRPALARST